MNDVMEAGTRGQTGPLIDTALGALSTGDIDVFPCHHFVTEYGMVIAPGVSQR